MKKHTDLNLLADLQLIYEHRSVSRAARRAGVTQPAMSQSLKALREMFDDQLFVRSNNQLIPTDLTEQIIHELQAPLQRIQDVAMGYAGMAGQHLEFVFVTPVVLDSNAAFEMMYPVLQAYPECHFVHRSWGEDTIDLLCQGKISLALGMIPELPKGINFESLGKDGFAVACRRGHALVTCDDFIEAYLAATHLKYDVQYQLKSPIDRLLAQYGKKRDIILSTDNIQGAVHIAEQSDYLLTAPRKVLEYYQRQYAIDIVDVPWQVILFSYGVYWSSTLEHRPGHGDIRQALIQQIRSMGIFS